MILLLYWQLVLITYAIFIEVIFLRNNKFENVFYTYISQELCHSTVSLQIWLLYIAISSNTGINDKPKLV